MYPILRLNPAGRLRIAPVIQNAPHDVGARRLNAQDLFRVLLIGKQDVHIGHYLPHSGAGLLRHPQIPPVIQIAAHRKPQLTGRPAGLNADLRHRAAQCRRDPGDMEPPIPIQDFSPLVIRGSALGDGAVPPVVYNPGGPLRRPLLQIEHAHALAAKDDSAGIHSVPAKFPDSRIGDVVFRKPCDKRRLHAHMGQRHTHVRLRSRIVDVEVTRLKKTLVPRRAQPHDKISKAQYSHGNTPFCLPAGSNSRRLTQGTRPRFPRQTAPAAPASPGPRLRRPRTA